jgi:hypothetical protein
VGDFCKPWCTARLAAKCDGDLLWSFTDCFVACEARLSCSPLDALKKCAGGQPVFDCNPASPFNSVEHNCKDEQIAFDKCGPGDTNPPAEPTCYPGDQASCSCNAGGGIGNMYCLSNYTATECMTSCDCPNGSMGLASCDDKQQGICPICK